MDDRLRRLAGILLAASLAPACSPSQTAGPAPGGEGAEEIVATVGAQPITLETLDEWIKQDLFREETEGLPPAGIHRLRADALERMLQERVLADEAQRQGVAVEALLEREVPAPQISDETVAELYDANRTNFAGLSLEQMAPRLRQHLERQSRAAAVERYVAGLRAQAGVEVLLQPPRTNVAASGPSLGPASAPVTIVEFSDFECPFCARAEPVVKELLRRYPDQVRLVYRHFPLDSIHPRARAAAEASACADEQGRFWEYHALLFANPRALSEADLASYAQQAGLDAEAFGACLGEGRTRALVERDLQAAARAGVQGTPAFFVNGILLDGARPLEEFVRVVENELERLGKQPAGPS